MEQSRVPKSPLKDLLSMEQSRVPESPLKDLFPVDSPIVSKLPDVSILPPVKKAHVKKVASIIHRELSL
ncbi:hypothetical protein TNCV_3327521 [Trichonephila clavipes]|nr:hypothetical protein TNCV_3327521 [Trichonephila clavipes]